MRALGFTPQLAGLKAATPQGAEHLDYEAFARFVLAYREFEAQLFRERAGFSPEEVTLVRSR